MNKRLKFLISISLIFAIFVSGFILPASSFANDIEVSTEKLLLVNIDTNTEVYSNDADTKWYAGYLSELMTFIVAYETIGDLVNTKFKVEKNYASSLPDSDGCLNPYIGMELSAKELMGIMVISSGNDAAYALADLAAGGNREAFVAEMNMRAQSYGMKDTSFASPGYDSTSSQVITCRDLYRLYMRVLRIDLYSEFMEKKSYIPESLYIEGDDAHNEAYTIYPEASVLNTKSPYYFKYVDTAKLSVTEATKAGIALTSLYHGERYFLAGLNGLSESEKNVYADTRKLISWAYLSLSDRKLINSNQKISEANVVTGWGDYKVSLYPPYSVVKTLPNEFDSAKLSYTEEVPDALKTPLRIDDTAGALGISYDGENIGGVRMVAKSEEGLGMLNDCGRFCSYVFGRLTPYVPEPAAEESTEAPFYEEEALTSEPTALPEATSAATEG